MTITLSDAAMANAERRARESGFADASAYLEHVFDDDADSDGFTEAEIDAALSVAREDIAAGRVFEMNEAFEGLFEKHRINGKQHSHPEAH